MRRRAFIRSTVGAGLAVPLTGRLAGYRVVSQDPGDVLAVRGDGSRVTLRGAAIRELARGLRGRLLLASSEGYETARLVLNPTIDRRPALIAQPANAADVQRAVAFAREYALLTAVKCGGHSFSGQSTCDGGIMIDLAGLRGVEVDPANRRARVLGGTLLGAVDRATRPHGLVTPLGTVSHTGVGGLTTGGGFGRVARRFGLALDNVTAVEVVTADGALRRASASEHPDLFWGVRGGGGNFGVVTAFEFRLHPMQSQVLGGDIAFPFERAAELLRRYNDVGLAAPDELYLDYFIALPPGGDRVCGVSVCYSGPPAGLDRLLAPIRGLATPLNDGVRPIEYVELQASTDEKDPRALGTYVKSGFTSEFSADMVRAVVEGIRPDPARATMFLTQHSGGAIGRVPTEATAFAHRYARFNTLAIVAWPAATDGAPHMAWARGYWASIERFTRGFYTNEVADESTAVINANYGSNYRRLVEVKNRYDPTNLFRLNANVRPTA